MEKIECEFCGISINTLPEWKDHHLAAHKTYSPWVPLTDSLGLKINNPSPELLLNELLSNEAP